MKHVVVPRVVVDELDFCAHRHQRDSRDELHLFLRNRDLAGQRCFRQRAFVRGRDDNDGIVYRLAVFVRDGHRETSGSSPVAKRQYKGSEYGFFHGVALNLSA